MQYIFLHNVTCTNTTNATLKTHKQYLPNNRITFLFRLTTPFTYVNVTWRSSFCEIPGCIFAYTDMCKLRVEHVKTSKKVGLF